MFPYNYNLESFPSYSADPNQSPNAQGPPPPPSPGVPPPLRIYEQRQRAAGRELLVRWRGFSAREASWVPEKAIEGSDALLKWDKDRTTSTDLL